MVEDLDQRLFLEFPLISFIKFSLDINYLSHLIFSCVDKAEKCCSIARSFRCHTNSSTPYQVWWRWDFPFVYMHAYAYLSRFYESAICFLTACFLKCFSREDQYTIIYNFFSFSRSRGNREVCCLWLYYLFFSNIDYNLFICRWV